MEKENKKSQSKVVVVPPKSSNPPTEAPKKRNGKKTPLEVAYLDLQERVRKGKDIAKGRRFEKFEKLSDRCVDTLKDFGKLTLLSKKQEFVTDLDPTIFFIPLSSPSQGADLVNGALVLVSLLSSITDEKDQTDAKAILALGIKIASPKKLDPTKPNYKDTLRKYVQFRLAMETCSASEAAKMNLDQEEEKAA